MSYTDASMNAAVDGMVLDMSAASDRVYYVSQHLGDPSNTGASEDTDVPRVMTTLGTASGGEATGTEVAHACKGGRHYTHYGMWTAITGGTFRWGRQNNPGFTLDADGIVRGIPRVTFPTS